MDKGPILGPNTWTFLMKYDYIGSRFKQFTTKTDIEGKFLTLAEISEGHWRQGAEKNIPPPSLPQQLYNFGGTNRKLLNSRKYKWPKCPKAKWMGFKIGYGNNICWSQKLAQKGARPGKIRKAPFVLFK